MVSEAKRIATLRYQHRQGQICIRLKHEKIDEIKAAAKAAGKSMPEFIYERCVGGKSKPE